MSLVFRNSRRLRGNSPRRRCATPAMARSGMARRAGTESLSWRGGKAKETRRGLPGEPADIHSRYIEAEVDGVLSASTFPMAIRHPGRSSRLQAALVRAPDILRGNTAQARCARGAGWRLQRHAHRSGTTSVTPCAKRRSSHRSLACESHHRKATAKRTSWSRKQ